MLEILPLLIGGLALFLYAISRLSAVMQDLFSGKAKAVIERHTRNLLVSIAIGTVLTVLLDSSSAVIILTIVFINAGTLSFGQAVGVIMGANIGTTFSSQIIALDVGKYAVIPLMVGLLMDVFVKHHKWGLAGKALLYFGMLFFGLFIMESAVEPLKNSSRFMEWLGRIEGNPLQGSLVGGLVTLIIQSSSGTVGMAIVLGKEGILSLAGGVAVMLGAELGTCSDTLLATIGGSKAGLRAGLFHLLFNFTTIILGLLLVHPFVALVGQLSSSADIGVQIANAHMLFNIFGVVVFLPVVRPLVRWMESWWSSKP